MARVATELQTAGRWYDGNLVRWVDGVLRTMGGWRALTGGAGPAQFALTGMCRGAHAWKNNSNVPFMVMGTHSKLYVYSGDQVYDITPAGLAAGRADTTSYLGYGVGGYGRGAYGTARIVAGATAYATTWAIDNFGADGLMINSDDGRLLKWDGVPANIATAVVATTGAVPTGNKSFLVTEERFCMVLGAGGDPRKVQWADEESYTAWLASATSKAGDQILQTVGTLRCAVKVRRQNLLLTDMDAHVGEYIGLPFVYAFKRVGTGCGVIGPRALEAADDAAYWMGTGGFFTYDGAVKPLHCDVGDYIFSDINRAQAEKVCAVRNPDFGEITWFYPSVSSLENDRYVTYNYRENVWYFGLWARTAGVSRGVFSSPVYIGADGAMYEHEVGTSYSGTTPYAESGPVEIGDGSRTYDLTSIVADERTLGQVTATFRARYYPTGTATTSGPYSLANPTSVRISGKQASVKVSGTADWRVGRFRFAYAMRGAR